MKQNTFIFQCIQNESLQKQLKRSKKNQKELKMRIENHLVVVEVVFGFVLFNTET